MWAAVTWENQESRGSAKARSATPIGLDVDTTTPRVTRRHCLPRVAL